MKKIIAIILVLSLCLSFAACGKKTPAAPEETEQQAATRSVFNNIVSLLYTNPNGIVLKENTFFDNDAAKSMDDINADLMNGMAKEYNTTTLFTVGEYTAYVAVVYVDISTTGERRIYLDRLVTKLDGETPKLVYQMDIPEETQNEIIAKFGEMEGAIESFRKDTIDEFSKNNKSFKSWYDKRKNSLKIHSSGYNFSLEPVVYVPPTERDNRVLVWSEEFEGVTSLSQTKVGHNGGMAMSADDLLQTNDDRNISFKDGVMIMRAHPYPDKSKYLYQTSQAVTSYQKMHFRGGYIELRARVPFEHGAWPSFWMKSIENEAEWMSEIDIFEIFASENNVVSAIHKWGADDHVSRSAGNHKHPSNEVATDWHTYGLEWTATELKFYVDQTCYSTVPISEEDDYDIGVPGMTGYQDYHYFLLNNFIFTTNGNQNYVKQNLHLTKDDTKEVLYEVDYIRLYQNPEVDRIVEF